MGTQHSNANPTWVCSTSAAKHAFVADLSFEPERFSEPPL